MKQEDIFAKLISSRQNYYESVFGKEDTVLKKIRKQAELEGIEYMQLSQGDAHILQLLTRLAQVKKAVEIGGLYGYSTLHIARGLVDSGCVYSLDMDSKRQALSQQLLKTEPEFSKIQWICGDAHQTLHTLSDKKPFDLCFIDADKAGYIDYLNWAEIHLKVGGLLVADNAFLFHTLYAKEPELSQLRKFHNVTSAGEKALKELNTRITSSSCWKGVMIPTEDGLAVAIKIK